MVVAWVRGAGGWGRGEVGGGGWELGVPLDGKHRLDGILSAQHHLVGDLCGYLRKPRGATLTAIAEDDDLGPHKELSAGQSQSRQASSPISVQGEASSLVCKPLGAGRRSA